MKYENDRLVWWWCNFVVRWVLLFPVIIVAIWNNVMPYQLYYWIALFFSLSVRLALWGIKSLINIIKSIDHYEE